MPRVLPPAARFVTSVATLLACGSLLMAGEQTANTLTAEEKAAGWKLLFDGKTLDGWRGFKSETPVGWAVVDGTLFRASAGRDIMTIDQFADFDLRLDWKIGQGGNSGIFFRATEESDEIWHVAPEMQVLHNAGHKDGQDPTTSAGSNYALHAPIRDVTKPVGEWNDVRIAAKGPHVEHWMNGVKLLEYELWSADWEARVKASKFVDYPGYGRAPRGHIGLQDHGDPIWYRNVKIRPL